MSCAESPIIQYRVQLRGPWPVGKKRTTELVRRFRHYVLIQRRPLYARLSTFSRQVIDMLSTDASHRRCPPAAHPLTHRSGRTRTWGPSRHAQWATSPPAPSTSSRPRLPTTAVSLSASDRHPSPQRRAALTASLEAACRRASPAQLPPHTGRMHPKLTCPVTVHIPLPQARAPGARSARSRRATPCPSAPRPPRASPSSASSRAGAWGLVPPYEHCTSLPKLARQRMERVPSRLPCPRVSARAASPCPGPTWSPPRRTCSTSMSSSAQTCPSAFIAAAADPFSTQSFASSRLRPKHASPHSRARILFSRPSAAPLAAPHSAAGRAPSRSSPRWAAAPRPRSCAPPSPRTAPTSSASPARTSPASAPPATPCRGPSARRSRTLPGCQAGPRTPPP